MNWKFKNSKSYSASLFNFLNTHPTPPSCCTSPPFIGTFPFFISPADLLLTRFRRCLSHHSFALPLFHHKTGILGVFLLFRVVYKHLMWKRLGKEHLINAKVTGSVVLISSWRLLRQVWWWWHLKLKENWLPVVSCVSSTEKDLLIITVVNLSGGNYLRSPPNLFLGVVFYL